VEVFQKKRNIIATTRNLLFLKYCCLIFFENIEKYKGELRSLMIDNFQLIQDLFFRKPKFFVYMERPFRKTI